jgi:hypothetical protein
MLQLNKAPGTVYGIARYTKFIGLDWMWCHEWKNNNSTVEPVKQVHPWDEPKVSLIQRCPAFTGQFALRTTVWDQMRCPYFIECPHFAGLLFTGFTVQSNLSSTVTKGTKKSVAIYDRWLFNRFVQVRNVLKKTRNRLAAWDSEFHHTQECQYMYTQNVNINRNTTSFHDTLQLIAPSYHDNSLSSACNKRSPGRMQHSTVIGK